MTEKLSHSEPFFGDIADNYKRICEKLRNAEEKYGKSGVRLMAVTKTVPVERVNFAVGCGISLTGENRVQEFLGKYPDYEKNIEIHFIGGLQNNKVKYIIEKVSMIHSVDSLRLAAEIDRQAEKVGRNMDILLEVNIAHEESKHGVTPEELDELISGAMSLKNVTLRGLMAIPPRYDGDDRYFASMERRFERQKKALGGRFDTLSMGMSGDYEAAVYNGSTLIRLGSALFGARG